MQNSQSELAQDAAEKQVALGMDQSAFKLRNASSGLEFQDGIENFDNTSVFTSSHVLFSVMSSFPTK